jgi:hypothetical protein
LRATEAWQRFISIHTQILALSRQNSNVVSFELSTHAKRQASVACQAAIEALAAQHQLLTQSRTRQ